MMKKTVLFLAVVAAFSGCEYSYSNENEIPCGTTDQGCEMTSIECNGIVYNNGYRVKDNYIEVADRDHSRFKVFSYDECEF
jgi:hypothetical protein